MKKINKPKVEYSPYKTLSEWRKSHPNAYRAAVRIGLIDEICKTFGWKRFERVKNSF